MSAGNWWETTGAGLEELETVLEKVDLRDYGIALPSPDPTLWVNPAEKQALEAFKNRKKNDE